MKVRSTEVQNNFGTYLKYAQFEDVIVTRNGKPVAVLRSYDSFHVAEGKPVYGAGQPEMSLDEFLDFASQSSERYEFIGGEVILLSSPTFEHQNIVLALGAILRDWFQETPCKAVVAPFDVFLEAFETTNVVQPDVVIICDLENINDEGRYSGVPTITVEVLSDSTRNYDMVKKLELYRASGVQEYWIVNPFTEEVYIYTFQEYEVHDYRVYNRTSQVSSSTHADLNIAVEAIFS